MPPPGRSIEARPGGALLPLRPPAHPPEPEPEGRLTDVDHWGRSQRARDLVAKVYGPLYRHWFRAEWEGLEKVPAAGGALLVANHAGAIPVDAPLLMHGIEAELDRPVYGLADYFFRSFPGVGTAWARGGGVPAHPDNAYRLLHDEGQLALVFPEGTKGTGKLWSERYRLRRFGRGGFVEIAMRAGVPIVPVAVIGSEEAMPTVARSGTLAKLLGVPYVPLTANMLLMGPLGLLAYFPAKIRFRVLDPVTFDVPPGQDRYSRSMVFDEAEKIRQSMQLAVYDMLRRRRSVWFG
ncbi:MAG TPA: lysophospholipid acyltransferase family protein [Acidimicrobiales bacterium]|nr:lysophospholipid acyltransferase family protein [Acidimicrobiales bacterium]